MDMIGRQQKRTNYTRPTGSMYLPHLGNGCRYTRKEAINARQEAASHIVVARTRTYTKERRSTEIGSNSGDDSRSATEAEGEQRRKTYRYKYIDWLGLDWG